MAVTTHLKALQALEMALRKGSLKEAAKELGITPAALGQRIRSLEDYLGEDLLVRGRSGLHPTPELSNSVADLELAFKALDRVTQSLDFQRTTEIHVVSDFDFADLWLLPRLDAFRESHPNISFCINGVGDVPVRLGAPDIRIEFTRDGKGDLLFEDKYTPVTGLDNIRRIGDWDKAAELEGLPFLHLESQREFFDHPGWKEWILEFGLRNEGIDRGVYYRKADVAMQAVKKEVGFLIIGLGLAQRDLTNNNMTMVYGPEKHVLSKACYRMQLRDPENQRPQIKKFCDWLQAEAKLTRNWLTGL